MCVQWHYSLVMEQAKTWSIELHKQPKKPCIAFDLIEFILRQRFDLTDYIQFQTPFHLSGDEKRKKE